jgi:hypothetical protein
MKIISISIVLSSWSQKLNASVDTDLELAGDCAAQFFVMTALSEQYPKMGDHFTNEVNAAEGTINFYLAAKFGRVPVTGEVSRYIDAALRLYKANSAEQLTADSLGHCLSWLGKQKQFTIENLQIAEEQPQNFLAHVPKPSDTYPKLSPAQRTKLDEMVALAKRSWAKQGRVIKDDLHAAVGLASKETMVCDRSGTEVTLTYITPQKADPYIFTTVGGHNSAFCGSNGDELFFNGKAVECISRFVEEGQTKTLVISIEFDEQRMISTSYDFLAGVTSQPLTKESLSCR